MRPSWIPADGKPVLPMSTLYGFCLYASSEPLLEAYDRRRIPSPGRNEFVTVIA
jgi:hypothetical protein